MIDDAVGPIDVLDELPGRAVQRVRDKNLIALEERIAASPELQAEAARAERVVARLLTDPGVELPEGFAESVRRAATAPGAPRPTGPRRGGSRWVPAMFVANGLLVATLVVYWQIGHRPEPDSEAPSIAELVQQIDEQSGVIAEQEALIKLAVARQKAAALEHDVALATLERDLRQHELDMIHEYERLIVAKTEELMTASVAAVDASSARIQLEKQLRELEAVAYQRAETIASLPSPIAIDGRIATLTADRKRVSDEGAARLADLDREIRLAGGDPARPPAELEVAISRERGLPWNEPAGRIAEHGDKLTTIDLGRENGLKPGTRFLVYVEGFGGTLELRGHVTVLEVLERWSVVQRLDDPPLGALAAGQLLFNPCWRNAKQRKDAVRVARVGATPALTPAITARLEKMLLDQGAALEPMNERTELVLVERDYAIDPGFQLARQLHLPILHVARIEDYLPLERLDLDKPAPPSAEALRLELDRINALHGAEVARNVVIHQALDSLGPRLRALSQASLELSTDRARYQGEVARREAHLRHLREHPVRRDPEPPRDDDRQGALDQRPDGRVMFEEEVRGTVRIDRGREHRLVRGLVFDVFRQLRGDKREPRARIEVIRVDARESIARVLGRFHKEATYRYIELPDAKTYDALPERVRRALELDPLRSDEHTTDLITSPIYDADRKRTLTVLGELRGRWSKPEVVRLLAEMGEVYQEEVDDGIDFAIAGLDHEADPRAAEVRKRGIPLLSQDELYRWLGAK